jgi:5,10-methylenetetrahydromethanopterin reductase
MEYGIQLATSAHHWKVVKRAEEMGFTHAWFYDTELLNAEMFVAMAAAAMQTSRIKLCCGVLIPSNRTAPVAASALASLNALAPGRIVCGMGTGFTARRTVGMKAITLKRLEDYIRVVRGLLARETVEWVEEGAAHKIRFLNPELGLVNLDDPIPIHLSAFGPKARALAAKLGAGWIAGGNPRGAVAALKAMTEAWTAAGRDAKDLYATTGGNGCVLAEGEAADSPRARAQAGPAATMIFHDHAEEDELGTLGMRIPPQFQGIFEAYRKIYATYEPADARYLRNHRGHLTFLRPEEQALVTAELIRTLTWTGTAAELADGVRAVKAAGFSQFAVTLRVGHEFDMLADWSKVLEKV